MSDATATTNGIKVNKFEGDGAVYKGKLIGMENLPVDRDEKVCLDSMFKLKAVAQARGEHKQRIQLNLTMTGVKVYDDTSKIQLAAHEVERIPFVVLDPRDQRAFGYVYNTSDDRHQFWAIKTERTAATTVLAMKELFETAFEEYTRSEKEKGKGNQSTPVPSKEQPSVVTPSSPSTPSPQPPTQIAPTPVTPIVDNLWGDNPTSTPSQPPPPQQQQPEANLDLWGANETNLLSSQPAPPAQADPLGDMFGLLGSPSPPPPPTSVPTVPQAPARPMNIQQAPPAAPADDLFSMFAPAAPAPTVNNTMPARPLTQAPIIPQQQQPNLLFAAPTPPVIPQQPNSLFSTPAPFMAPQQPPPQQQNLFFSTPAPAIVPQQQPIQPNLLMSTPAPAVVPPPAAKPVDDFDLLADFS